MSPGPADTNVGATGSAAFQAAGSGDFPVAASAPTFDPNSEVQRRIGTNGPNDEGLRSPWVWPGVCQSRFAFMGVPSRLGKAFPFLIRSSGLISPRPSLNILAAFCSKTFGDATIP